MDIIFVCEFGLTLAWWILIYCIIVFIETKLICWNKLVALYQFDYLGIYCKMRVILLNMTKYMLCTYCHRTYFRFNFGSSSSNYLIGHLQFLNFSLSFRHLCIRYVFLYLSQILFFDDNIFTFFSILLLILLNLY